MNAPSCFTLNQMIWTEETDDTGQGALIFCLHSWSVFLTLTLLPAEGKEKKSENLYKFWF